MHRPQCCSFWLWVIIINKKVDWRHLCPVCKQARECMNQGVERVSYWVWLLDCLRMSVHLYDLICRPALPTSSTAFSHLLGAFVASNSCMLAHCLCVLASCICVLCICMLCICVLCILWQPTFHRCFHKGAFYCKNKPFLMRQTSSLLTGDSLMILLPVANLQQVREFGEFAPDWVPTFVLCSR